MSTILSWLRTIWLLRQPQVLAELAERRSQRMRLDALRQQFPSAKIGSQVHLIGLPSTGSMDRLSLGEQATLCDGSVLAFVDDANDRSRIVIGARSWIGQYNNLRAGGGDIHIGADCLISQFCSLVASNHGVRRDRPIKLQHASTTKQDVRLGDDVWLGAGCAVMAGVVIGNGAVIGANAVVTTDVPEYEIWAGVPARRIGERE